MHARLASATGRATALLAATILLTTTGCSLLEDDEASSATPSTIVAAKTVDVAVLEGILPQPAAFGPEFALGDSEIWSSDDEGSEGDGDLDLDATFEESCPGFEKAFDSISNRFETQPSVERSFTAPDGRAFMVGASSHADNVFDAVEEAAMADAVQVISLCPTATVAGDGGLQTTVTLDAHSVDGYGEWATAFEVRMSMTHPNLAVPVTMTMDYLYLGVGSVTVGVFTADGLDSNTRTVAQADRAKRDAAAANLAMMAAAVQMAAAPEASTPESAPT